ncbi:GNAT family N-acetyltransferase [Candidatus Kirkpatrickella diaphorinae]|uniref:GNAT family N-acetyltransferase n=1 Tax=Candidatus Kirkpatrickella diaphorinae TaxID=2984322 RepID=A0ABY6GJ85_9PROT|nr:GNAT family N-acetyltransferase [Candidatus Kirkpatrickella diaphorinae]UYH51329.1 GNAT family N-acetyltransferase [Candidatus Kirkpatrickella diaphorinae]
MTSDGFSIAPRAEAIPAADWRRCVGDDVLTGRDFFLALEQSGSAVPSQGWHPCHGVLRENGQILAIAPLYVKSHSLGEYVFDQPWAEAFMAAGGRYYPKLTGCVPFTPVSGARISCGLTGKEADMVKRRMAAHMVEMAQSAGLSSAHLTFCTEEEATLLAESGWLTRRGLQYHWINDAYADFSAFLGSLTSRKRKMIRKERDLATSYGLTFSTRRGDSLRPDEWRRINALYRATTDRRCGNAYLAPGFFASLAASQGENIILMTASRDGEIIAAALNILSGDTLYGRYWCCAEDWPALHFELCYYQAIEWAIAHQLKRVEAGAQGTHKISRGYRPTYTWSAHYIAHEGLRKAVQDFLMEEAVEMAAQKRAFEAALPYRDIFSCE